MRNHQTTDYAPTHLMTERTNKVGTYVAMGCIFVVLMSIKNTIQDLIDQHTILSANTLKIGKVRIGISSIHKYWTLPNIMLYIH